MSSSAIEAATSKPSGAAAGYRAPHRAAERRHRKVRRARPRQHRGGVEGHLRQGRPDLSRAEARHVLGPDALGLRRGAERDGAVLLPERPRGLSRHRVLQRSRDALPRLQRQGLPVRAGLCDRARGRPSRAEPARHPAQGAAGAARAPATARSPIACRCMVELQADCFAGVWANNAEAQYKFLDPGDIDAALQTASAIGDDTLQRQVAGHGGAGQLHPRQRRAAQAMVLDRLQGGRREGLQHFRGGPGYNRTTMPGIDDKRPFVPLKIAVLTVSDTREAADDKSGATLAERIEKAGHAVAGRAIVTDDVEKIRAQMRTWIADKGDRRHHLDRRHRLHRPRRDARSGRAAVREADGRLLRRVSLW